MKKKTGLNKKQISDVIMAVLIQVLTFFPWIQSQDETMNIWLYLIKDFREKSHMKTYIHTFLGDVKELTGETSLIPAMFWFIGVVIVMMQLLSLLYAYVSVKKYFVVKGFGYMRSELLVLIILAVGLMSSLGLAAYVETNQGDLVSVFPGQIFGFYSLFIVLAGVWILAGKMFETWDETARTVKQEREQKEQYRKERKKRLYFPGRYSKLYYTILWKDLKSRYKAAFFLCFSVFLSTLFLYTGIGIRNIFSASYSEAASGVLGLGLLEIMSDFLLVSVVVSVFLVTIVLSVYRRKRVGNTGVFHILGVRSHDFFVVWIVEMVSCFVVSVSIGLIAGGFFLRLLCMLIRKIYPSVGELGTAGVSAYMGTVGGMLIIFLFAFGFSHDMQAAQRSMDVRGAMVQSEELPGRFKYWWLGIGCVIAA